MTLDERKTFINSLCNSIRDDMLSKAPRIPETWDGFELRTWIADNYNERAGRARMSRGRKKAYLSDIQNKGL